jgi:hypothetical protein
MPSVRTEKSPKAVHLMAGKKIGVLEFNATEFLGCNGTKQGSEINWLASFYCVNDAARMSRKKISRDDDLRVAIEPGVDQAIRILLKFAHRMGATTAKVFTIPSMALQLFLLVAKIPSRWLPSTTGVFPFQFRWQSAPAPRLHYRATVIFAFPFLGNLRVFATPTILAMGRRKFLVHLVRKVVKRLPPGRNRSW